MDNHDDRDGEGNQARFAFVNIRVKKPNYEELAEINSGYVKWLRRIGGASAEEFYLSHLREVLAAGSRDDAIAQIKLVELGNESIRFSPWTTECPFGPIEDPINIVFRNRGSADEVADKFKNVFIPAWVDTSVWGLTCARAHYVFIDNTNHGGTCGWIKMSKSLTNCGCFRRCHIRLFDGGTDTHLGGFGEYSVGSIHYEVWQKLSHVVKSWDGAQQFVDSVFSSAFPFVGAKSQVCLQSSQVLKGIVNDGMGTMIELR
jgi:hypothetical protein